MYFAATKNIAIIGYRTQMASFKTKKERDEFCKHNSDFSAITAKEANAYDQIAECRRYQFSIIDTNNKLNGIIYFDFSGNFHSISWV